MTSSPLRPFPLRYPSPFPFFIFAGPCSAETEDQTIATARALRGAGIRFFRASLWKPRTRPGSFEGVGEVGLAWLRRVEEELGMQAATEIASPQHAEAALKAGIDTFWIGARTSASPFAMAELATALAGTTAKVLVKNPLNPDIDLWEGALLRLQQAGIEAVGAIHRGFSTYAPGVYRNAPLWQLPIELQRRHPELTIFVDPSHIAGRRDLVPLLCQMGLEMNFAGLMIETHPHPESAWSDAAQQLTPEALVTLLRRLEVQPASMDAETNLQPLRREIDQLDRQLLELLSDRMRLAQQIGQIKAEAHLPIVQPERYRDLLESRLEIGSQLGLDEGFLRELFSSIHEASVHAQHTEHHLDTP